MTIELSKLEIETLLESLNYSKRAIEDAQGTPDEVRKENLERIESAIQKLRVARNASK